MTEVMGPRFRGDDSGAYRYCITTTQRMGPRFRGDDRVLNRYCVLALK